MASSSFLCTNFNRSNFLDINACNRSSQDFMFNLLLRRHEAYSKKHQVFGISLPRNIGDFPHQRSILKTASIDHLKRSNRDFAIKCSPEPSGLLPFLPPDNSWIKWLWGLVAIVPFVIQRLLTLTREVDTAAETVEEVSDTVEMVAEDAEKLAEDISQNLPQGGKLKQMVSGVANVAKETAKDAQLAEDLMDKIEEVDQDVESIITMDQNQMTKQQTKIKINVPVDRRY